MSQETELQEEEMLAHKYITALDYYSEEHQKEVIALIDRGNDIRGALWKIHNNYSKFSDHPTKAQLEAVLAEFNITPQQLEIFLEKSRQHWKEVDERVKEKQRDEAARRALDRLMKEGMQQ